MLITEKLKNQKNFSATENIIADYLLTHVDTLANLSTRQLGSLTSTAPSTIVRFCQKLGYRGFNEFKTAYLKEIDYFDHHFTTIDPNYPFLANDKNTQIAAKMAMLYHEAIDDSLALISHDYLQKAINLINNAHTVYIYSAGVQLDLCQAFKDKMLRIGKNVIIEPKADSMFYLASMQTAKQVFIVISYSGQTEIMLRIANKIVEHHPLIAITSYGDNPLSSLADVTLQLSTREKLVENLGHFAINISLLYLLDILYVGCFNSHYDQHLTKRISSSHGFELYRKSTHPILDDNDVPQKSDKSSLK